MFGANKSGHIYRRKSGTYMKIGSFKFRYQPIKESGEKPYRTKSSHIEYQLFCGPEDITTGDKITDGCNGVVREFIVIGGNSFGDSFGKHQENIMRELHTSLHDKLVVLSLDPTQASYDPLMKEWTSVAGKTFTQKTVSALVDPAEASKSQWVKVIESGKFEEIDYVVTLELGSEMNLDDRITLPDGDQYLVKWRFELPYQNMYGVKKSFDNISYNVL